jgi:CRISPR-associated protein Cas2
MYFLISFDITSNKRRRIVARYLLNYGKRIQKSVFECHVTEKIMETMVGELAKLIEHREDKIRFWQICKDCIERVEVVGWGDISLEDDEFWVV